MFILSLTLPPISLRPDDGVAAIVMGVTGHAHHSPSRGQDALYMEGEYLLGDLQWSGGNLNRVARLLPSGGCSWDLSMASCHVCNDPFVKTGKTYNRYTVKRLASPQTLQKVFKLPDSPQPDGATSSM